MCPGCCGCAQIHGDVGTRQKTPLGNKGGRASSGCGAGWLYLKPCQQAKGQSQLCLALLPVPASPVNFIQLTTPAAKNRFQDTQWDLCCGGVWEYLCYNSSSVMHWLKPLVKSLPEFSCWILLTLEPYLGTMLGNALCCLKCWWAVILFVWAAQVWNAVALSGCTHRHALELLSQGCLGLGSCPWACIGHRNQELELHQCQGSA